MAAPIKVDKDLDTPKSNHNNQMRAAALRKRAARAYAWRTRVYAEQELRVREINAQLIELGFDPTEAPDVDFDDDDKLRKYAEIVVPK